MQYVEFRKSFGEKYAEFARENNLCDVNFEDDLMEKGMDSFKYISFLIYLEELYGVSFDDTFFLLRKMYTLDKLANFVWELVEKK